VKTRAPNADSAEPLVGAHMSISGDAWCAFERIAAVGGNALQIFVKSNVQWAFPTVSEADVERFAEARRASGVKSVIAHACYLANLATSESRTRRRSRADVERELSLASRYGIEWLVLHPGNHVGAGVSRGIGNVSRALRAALGKSPGCGVLIETTAGAGTALGARLEEIAEIIEKAGGERLGVCFDTAHLHAAGYALSDEAGYRAFKRELRSLGLLRLVKAIHVNDSKSALGGRLDRHEHIGKGAIGRGAFARIMRDGDFAGVPKILETPKGLCGKRDCDKVNIALLKRLARSKGDA
jgi:deoxyribonuclease-4